MLVDNGGQAVTLSNPPYTASDSTLYSCGQPHNSRKWAFSQKMMAEGGTNHQLHRIDKSMWSVTGAVGWISWYSRLRLSVSAVKRNIKVDFRNSYFAESHYGERAILVHEPEKNSEWESEGLLSKRKWVNLMKEEMGPGRWEAGLIAPGPEADDWTQSSRRVGPQRIVPGNWGRCFHDLSGTSMIVCLRLNPCLIMGNVV